MNPLPLALAILTLTALPAVAQTGTLMNPNRSAWPAGPGRAETRSRLGAGEQFHGQSNPRVTGSTGTLLDGRPGRFGMHHSDPTRPPQVGSGPGRLSAPRRFADRWWHQGNGGWQVYDHRARQWRSFHPGLLR